MSDRRDRLLDPPLLPLELDEPDEPDELEESDDVEYFVDVELDCWVLTSVPKSSQFPQSWSSAPSTFTVFGDADSAPHISHCTIREPLGTTRLKWHAAQAVTMKARARRDRTAEQQ